MRQPQRVRGLAVAATIALTAAACGRGEHQSAPDSTKADSTQLGPPTGSFKPAADSAVSAGTAQIDSLKQAGATPAQGMDSAAARGAAAAANDSARNVPGVPEMRKRPGETTGPGGTKSAGATKRP